MKRIKMNVLVFLLLDTGGVQVSENERVLIKSPYLRFANGFEQNNISDVRIKT